jgi:hypothetical protein
MWSISEATHVMIHAQPNGTNSDDKYTMVVYKMTKTKTVYQEANRRWHTESH